MALDTVVLNVGVGGKSIGVDNISSVDYEVVKQAYGVEGALTLVSASNPLPVAIADGADVTEGAIADAIVAAGATGTQSAKLRRLTQGIEDLKTAIILAAGSAIIGKVGIDQTTPGTTNGVQVNNTVTTSQASPTTIFNGKTLVTTATTRVVLASSQAIKSVTIKALSTNGGVIYVGDTSVSSTNGFQLSAGDSVSMDIANLNTVNIDSSVNGEGVTYFAVN